jgi:hypothetical protein
LAEAIMLENLTITGLLIFFSKILMSAIRILKIKDTQMGLKSFAHKKKPVWTHQDTRIKPS